MSKHLSQEELDELTKLIIKFDENKLPSKFLVQLIENYIDTPFCLFLENGEFLWVNSAWCNLVEYTITEMVDKKIIDWRSLTADPKDLMLDNEQLKAIKNGEIDSYATVKHIQKKSGPSILVKSAVTRYPLTNNILFYICVLTSVTDSQKAIMTFLKEHREDVEKWQKRQYKILKNINEAQTKAIENDIINKFFTRLTKFADTYPKLTFVCVIIILGTIFGDSVTTILDKVSNVLEKINIGDAK